MVTTFFVENFETGDLTAWNSKAGNPAVQSTTTRTGQYACSSTVTATSRNNSITKTGTAQTSIYLRFYVYFSVLPPSNSEVLIARCAYNASRPLVSVFNSNSSLHWRLRDGGGTLLQHESGPAAQTWYCLELKAAANDESALYVNGNRIISGAAPSGSSNSIALMAYNYYGAADGTTVTFDDVAYSDTYNRPQNLTQAITDSLSTLDLNLRNKQLQTSDNVSAAENLLRHKSLAVTDQITESDAASASKQLITNENLTLSEAAQLGIRGHVKTKLFLILADMAVQLTGD